MKRLYTIKPDNPWQLLAIGGFFLLGAILWLGQKGTVVVHHFTNGAYGMSPHMSDEAVSPERARIYGTIALIISLACFGFYRKLRAEAIRGFLPKPGMRQKVRTAIIRIAWGLGIWLILESTGIIRLTYPLVVSTEGKLVHPIKVKQLRDEHIVLADGRTLAVDHFDYMSGQIEEYGYQIDLEPLGSDPEVNGFLVFVSEPRGVCGDALHGLITLPVIPIPMTRKARRMQVGQAWLAALPGKTSSNAVRSVLPAKRLTPE